MKGTPASAAITRASSVLPVPGKNRKSKQALGVARTHQYAQSVPRSKDRWGVCDRPPSNPTNITYTHDILTRRPREQDALGEAGAQLAVLGGRLEHVHQLLHLPLGAVDPCGLLGFIGLWGSGVY